MEATATARTPQAVAAVSRDGVPNAAAAARSLFAALNRRDVSALLSLLSEDVVYENLGCDARRSGRADVGRFYLEALAGLPEEAVFVLDDDGDGGEAEGPVLQAGVTWHLELNGMPIPLSRGVGAYRADPRTGRLSRIVDSPEAPLKLPGPLLSLAVGAGAAWAPPLVLSGLAPAARGFSSLLESLTPGGGAAGLGGALSSLPIGGGGGGLGGDSLADGVVSALHNLLPFQRQPASAGRRAAVAAAGASGGGGNRMMHRERSWSAGGAASGGGAVRVASRGSASAPGPAPVPHTAATASGSATAAATTSSSSPATRPGPSAPAATPSAGGSSARAASTATATPNRAVGTAAAASTAGASTGTASSSRGDPIRMRTLPGPEVPSSPRGAAAAAVTAPAASTAAATSFGSTEGRESMSARRSGGGSADKRSPGALASAASGSSFASAGSSTDEESPSFPSSSASTPVPTPASPSSRPSSSASASPAAAAPASAATPAAAAAAGPAVWALPFTPATSTGVNLSGLWEKDAEASQVQEYEAMLDVLQLGGLQKVTARLIDGLDLAHEGERFEVSFVTVVPFFRVTEKSRFGQPTTMTRRDLRDPLTGRQTSVASRVPGGVLVDMGWGAPLAGSLREEYVVSADGQRLAVTSSIRIGERAASATQVYRRSSRNKSDFLASQRSSYGSLEDVLRSQEKKYGKVQM